MEAGHPVVVGGVEGGEVEHEALSERIKYADVGDEQQE